EGMSQHQELGFGVGPSSDGRLREPRVADLASIGSAAAVQGMAARPGPPLQIEEASGADDDPAIQPDDGKRDSSAAVPGRQSCIYVIGGLALPLRNRTPLVKSGINRGSGCQRVDMVSLERFQANLPAWQHKGVASHTC